MQIIQNNKIKCDKCQKELEFKSENSNVCICSCKNKVTKDKNFFEEKTINLLSDYSKIKLGTKGRYNNCNFTVIGRLQIKYTNGFWNRWNILFENGKTAWLSEFFNQYIITFKYLNDEYEYIKDKLKLNTSFKEINNFYYFNKIEVDNVYLINNINYVATDVIESKIVGAEGELNFNLNKNKIKIIKFKKENIVISADYSENDNNPVFYFGEHVREEDLCLSNYKSIEDLRVEKNENKGKLTTFVCPICKCSNPKISGETNMVYCISCNAQLDVSEPNVKFLKKGDNKHHKYDTSLQCGKIGEIYGVTYIIIGVVLKKEPLNNNEWVEYFLYPKNGHNLSIWLLEDRSTGEWYISELINYLPIHNLNNKNTIEYKKNQFKKEKNKFTRKVIGLWGSLNHLVDVDDETIIENFSTIKNGEYLTISKEEIKTNNKEINYLGIKNRINKKISTQLILNGFDITQANLIANNNKLYEYISKTEKVSNSFNAYKILFFAISFIAIIFNSEKGLEKSLIGVVMSLFVLISILSIGFWGELMLTKKRNKYE
jgi:hypothetical protein